MRKCWAKDVQLTTWENTKPQPNHYKEYSSEISAAESLVYGLNFLFWRRVSNKNNEEKYIQYIFLYQLFHFSMYRFLIFILVFTFISFYFYFYLLKHGKFGAIRRMKVEVGTSRTANFLIQTSVLCVCAISTTHRTSHSFVINKACFICFIIVTLTFPLRNFFAQARSEYLKTSEWNRIKYNISWERVIWMEESHSITLLFKEDGWKKSKIIIICIIKTLHIVIF